MEVASHSFDLVGREASGILGQIPSRVKVAHLQGLLSNGAAAAQLPQVISRPCGAANILVYPSKNGWLVDPDDVQDMADAIAKMMSLTPNLRKKMGKASRLIVADWGPQRFAAGLSAAAAMALRAKRRPFAIWDRLLFSGLAKLRASKVT